MARQSLPWTAALQHRTLPRIGAAEAEFVMKISIDPAAASADARLVAFTLGNGLLIEHQQLSVALDLKPVALLVWLTVSIASAQRYMRQHPRDPAYRGAVALPDELSGSISRRAIARATGLPAETVRRCVADLVAQGRMEVLPDGSVRTPPGNINRVGPEPMQAILTAFAHQAESLLQAGVLRVVD
jgi:hypothetical protein